jgi:hypothetical protein
VNGVGGLELMWYRLGRGGCCEWGGGLELMWCRIWRGGCCESGNENSDCIKLHTYCFDYVQTLTV